MTTFPPIGLLTDFGTESWYVAAMKGEILRRAPQAPIVDLCHTIPPQRVDLAGFLLNCLLPSMPPGMVFCCVVDPGVGTTRGAICGRVGPWLFAGPDNGLVTPLLKAGGYDAELFEIHNPAFTNPEISDTFHGRDIFAPAAAMLATGADPREAGLPVREPKKLKQTLPEIREDGIVGRVMIEDHFGNLITNITRSDFEERLGKRGYVIRAGGLRLDTINRTYGEVRQVEALAYWGSGGTLEIGVNLGSASEVTGLGYDDRIFIQWVDAAENPRA